MRCEKLSYFLINVRYDFEKFKQVLNLGTKIHRFTIANNNVIENNDTL
jgi:hypothetical protein